MSRNFSSTLQRLKINDIENFVKCIREEMTHYAFEMMDVQTCGIAWYWIISYKMTRGHGNKTWQRHCVINIESKDLDACKLVRKIVLRNV